MHEEMYEGVMCTRMCARAQRGRRDVRGCNTIMLMLMYGDALFYD